MNFVFSAYFDQIFQYLNYAQLAAILLGIAATIYLDFKLTRLCGKGRITKRLYLHIRAINKTSIFAALVVWSTLLIQISHYGITDPSALAAQDLWARISIGTVLGLNLYLIRHLALPKAKRRIGLSIYGALSDSQLNRMLGIGAISSISWVALLLLWLMGKGVFALSLGESYPAIMSIYVLTVVAALAFCKFCGKWARQRFFENLEKKRTKYRKITRTTARRNVVGLSTHTR
ncbi:MAG: hypothetical protein KTR32_34395 [Granulosicoccus sp.]|nr:hypothetical protein [Granulosicoccus sp.]